MIDLHVDEFEREGWGRVYLHPYHGGKNQRWRVTKNGLASEYKGLRFDLYSEDAENIGGYTKQTNGQSKRLQDWDLILSCKISRCTSDRSSDSCIDKTEKGIYSVVQYVPLLATLWDLGSSIGYAAAGCTKVAEE